MNANTNKPYGSGDASFLAAGSDAGIRRLVDDFYYRIGSDARFARIHEMHPDDKATSRGRLARIPYGWLGGPRLCAENYGAIGIPRVHAHLEITKTERDQWLSCMAESVDLQPYAADFKQYLVTQLTVPAEAVRCRCAANTEVGE